MKIKTTRKPSTGQFFFNFLTNDDKVILKSEAYNSREACDNGKKSVRKNAGNEDRYDRLTSSDNRFYFNLKAANGEIIGTSVLFDTEAERENAIKLLKGLTPKKAKPAEDTTKFTPPAPTPPTPSDKGGSKELDDYRAFSFYRSNAGSESGFSSFQGRDDDEYYFTFNGADGNVILISQGYTGANGRDNGIESVKTNSSISERYSRMTTDAGKHYFSLKAGNNQEIARSIEFDSDGEMEATITFLMSGGKAPAVTKEVEAPSVSDSGDDNEKIYKDYKPLSFYEPRIEGVEFGFDPFAEGDDFYFTVNREGTPLLLSEDYTSEAGRDNGIESIKKNVKNENRYVRKVHPNGMHYFNLIAGNKQEIATSIWFENAKDMEKAIAWLTSTGGTRRRKKAKRAKKPAAERRYLEQGLSYPCSEITYDTFQSGGNEKFYFVFKTKEDKAILINGDVRGIKTEEDLKSTISELIDLAPHKDNYEIKSTKNGKVYFYVNNKDGKHIGRSSLFYNTEDEMNAAIALLACGVGAGSSRVVDDYLECEAYSGVSGFHKFKNDENGEFYFGYNGANGKTYLRSEGYTNEAGRDNGIESVIKNAPIEERWKTGEDDGKWYYSLRAGNNQEIARSCYYESEEAMNVDYNWIRGDRSTIGKGATLVDGVWMSAYAIRQKEEEARLAVEAAAKRKAEEAAKKKAAEEAEAARLAAEEVAKNQRVVDDYLPCEDYKGDGGFHRFYREDRKEYYFSFNGNKKTLLRSEGYTQERARENGIESVIKNAPNDDRWGTDTALNGKYHYYYLRAGNNQEIARSCYYEDEAAMMIDYNWLRGEQSTIGKGAQLVDGIWMSAFAVRQKEEEAAKLAAAAKEAEKPSKVIDDYLPCADYTGDEGFHTFYREDKKEYYFAYNNDKGKTYLRSEGYTSASGRDNGIQSVIKNAPIEKRWTTGTALNGKYYYYALKAGNNQEIARSCYYKDEAAMLADFEWIRGDRSSIGVGSAMVGGALMSAWAIGQQKAATPPKPEDKDDDYMPCGEYRGRAVNDKQNNVALFKHDDGQYYFAIYNDDGSVRLRSEGFPDAKKRDEELSGALKNLENEEMYHIVKKTFTKGTYTMKVLLDKTGREVGRSCLEKEEPAIAAAPIVEDREDDYLGCKHYRDHDVNDKQNNVAFFKHKNGKFYFVIYDDNGKVRLRSEGFTDPLERDVELSGALKNIDKEEMYQTLERGDYKIKVLYDKTGREVGRSCPEKKVVAVPVAAAAAAAATTIKKEEPVAAAPVVTEAAGGGFNWWWLLPLLLIPLLFLLFRGCDGCGNAAVVPPAEEVEQTPPPAPEPEPVDTVEAEPPAPAPTPVSCDCNASNHPVFNLKNRPAPKSLSRLGTNPEFGNSHGLSPAQFYNKLNDRYNSSTRDKQFLDAIFREMGYSGWSEANASLFSDVTIPKGTDGNMGYSSQHRTVYASLDTNGRDLLAFKIEAANGCDLNFMKTCGNHFFFCPN